MNVNFACFLQFFFLLLAPAITSFARIAPDSLHNELFWNIENLHVKQAAFFEEGVNSKDITRDYLVTVGESIYPNKKKYNLATPKTYKRKDGEFELEIDYYYTKPDSLVKVVLYQWGESSADTVITDELLLQRQLGASVIRKRYNAFQGKFNGIEHQLIEKIGDAYVIERDKGKRKVSHFRLGAKWKSKDGLNFYLFMLGDNSTQFRQIRLAVYKD